MQRKSVTRLLSALLCLALVAGAVFSLAHAKRRDAGSVPVRVLITPSTVTSGSKPQITVYLNDVTSTDQVVNMTTSGSGLKNGIVDGPGGGSVTIPAGNDNVSYSPTITGDSGDEFTITGTCNGYQASGTVTVQ